MGRPFVSLALVFALILAGAGGLIIWSERDQRQAASDPVGQPVGIASGTSGSAAPGAAPPAQTAEKGPADAEVAGGPAPTEAEVAAGESLKTTPPLADAGVAADTVAAEANPNEPSFDVVRVEPTGDALIAGRAPAGADLEVVVDGKVVARTTADAEGAFVALPDSPLEPGQHQLSLRIAGATAPPGAEQTVAVAVPQAGEGAAEIVPGEQQVAAAEQPASEPADRPAANVPAGGAGAEQDATDSNPSGAGVAGAAPGSQQPGTGLAGGAEPGTQAGGEVAQGEAAPGQTGQPAVSASGAAGEPDALVAGVAGAGPAASAGPGAQVGSGQDVAAVAPPPGAAAGSAGAPDGSAQAPVAGSAGQPDGAFSGLADGQEAAGTTDGEAPAPAVGQGGGATAGAGPEGADATAAPPVAGSAGQPNTGLSESAESDLAARMSAGERPAGTIEQNDGTAPAAGGEAADQEIARLEPPSGAEASGPDTQGSADLSAGPGAAGAAGGTDPGRIEGNVVAGAPDEAPAQATGPGGRPAPDADQEIAGIAPGTGQDAGAAPTGTGSAAALAAQSEAGKAGVGQAGAVQTGVGPEAEVAGSEIGNPPTGPGTDPVGSGTPAVAGKGDRPDGVVAGTPGADQAGDAIGAPDSGQSDGAGAPAGSSSVAGLGATAPSGAVAGAPAAGEANANGGSARSDGSEPLVAGADLSVAGNTGTPGALAGVENAPVAGSGDLAAGGTAGAPGTETGAEAAAGAGAGPGAGTATPDAGGLNAGAVGSGARETPGLFGEEREPAAGSDRGAPSAVDVAGLAPAERDPASGPEAAGADGSAVPNPAGAAAAAPPQVLAIKAAEAEARNLYVAGEAAPGTLVRVYAGEEFVGDAQASEHGTWLVEAQKELPVGDVTIRADAAARGTQTASARAELPFVRYADGLVLEPAAAVTAGGQAANVSAAVPQPTFVIIRRGDNLWRISKRQYGRGIRYESIFAANRELIRNPDRIYPGQAFVLPQRDRGWETPAN